jgi:hypothetical protein
VADVMSAENGRGRARRHGRHARIACRAEDCIAAIEEYWVAGCTHMILELWGDGVTGSSGCWPSRQYQGFVTISRLTQVRQGSGPL